MQLYRASYSGRDERSATASRLFTKWFPTKGDSWAWIRDAEKNGRVNTVIRPPDVQLIDIPDTVDGLCEYLTKREDRR